MMLCDFRRHIIALKKITSESLSRIASRLCILDVVTTRRNLNEGSCCCLRLCIPVSLIHSILKGQQQQQNMAGVEVAVSSIISLAKLAWQTCVASQVHKQNCVRIGNRLMNLMVLTKEWTETTTTTTTQGRRDGASKQQQRRRELPSLSSLKTLQGVLERLNLTLQAVTTKRSKWTKRVRQFVGSIDTLTALERAESDLNSALQDFQVAQNNEILSIVTERFDQVEQILLHLANKIDPQSGKAQTTFLQEIQTVLEHQHQAVTN